MIMRTRTSRRLAWVLLGTVFAASVATPGHAQRRRFGGGWNGAYIAPNVPYDGRFTFARIRYEEIYSNGWAYDYPDTERNFATILREITSVQPYMDGGNVFTFDDPELFRYPVAYVSEPGFWYPSKAEAEGLRDYLAKGGFVIFDDFNYANEWMVFEAGLRQALPNAKIVPMDASHPIFDSFFRIPSLEMTYPGRPSLQAEFYGIYEDNDPKKRLMVIINYNNDIGDYLEHSGRGRYPINLTNDAYKFAVNYILYGMTR
jgi:hypothetical protein